jgi:formylglycine-generating enzyme
VRGACSTILTTAVAVASCVAEPKPLPEALVVVQTDVAVPLRVGRLRIDIHDSSGVLLETREVVTPTAEEWPVSFSVVSQDETAEREFIVRLRAHPEGHVLSARQLERFARQPVRNVTVHPTLDALCNDAPLLRLAEPLTLRRGANPITTVLRSNRNGKVDCERETKAGSVAARLEIAETGSYQIEVVRAVPDGARNEPGGDTTLSLRTRCAFPTTQIACADDIAEDNHLSRLVIDLDPGTYFVVTGGDTSAAADLTLLASRVDAIQEVPTPPPAPLTESNVLMPEPGVTIDRLVVVRLRPGERGNVDVTLHGECFGTPADLSSRASCIDRAGERTVATVEVPRQPIMPTRARVPASWQGDERVACTVAPRPDSVLFDGEVCIPGGAFVLGDTLALVDLDQRAQPERMRVVEPFLMDVHEMTVGRYREAVRRGFKPADDTPRPNGEPLDVTATGKGCTWNVAGATSDPASGIDREAYPLTCVSWSTARAVCEFLGGALPTEDQWEYAATAATGTSETPYPWGRELPTCARTVFGRFQAPLDQCASAGLGPVRVNDPLLVNGDVNAQGVVGLGGNVQEWLSTAFVPYADAAWERAGLRAPLDEAEAPLRAVRGADWSGFSLFATGSARRAQASAGTFTTVGFRCVRRGR